MTLDEIQENMHDIEKELLGYVHPDKWTEHKILTLIEDERWYKLFKLREKYYDS